MNGRSLTMQTAAALTALILSALVADAAEVTVFTSVALTNALDELAHYFRRYDLTNGVVVSPDLGNAKSAAAFARKLEVPVAAGAKERLSDTEVSHINRLRREFVSNGGPIAEKR